VYSLKGLANRTILAIAIGLVAKTPDNRKELEYTSLLVYLKPLDK
jgi:hypothetical protein